MTSERAALREWLLDRLEVPRLWPASGDDPPQITTVDRLADAVRADTGFMQIAELSLRAGQLAQSRKYFERYLREYAVNPRCFTVRHRLVELEKLAAREGTR
mgnify:CR=1 FL=1